MKRQTIIIIALTLTLTCTSIAKTKLIQDGLTHPKLLSTDDLFRIYVRDIKRWKSTNQLITVYSHPINSNAHKTFLNEIFNISASNFEIMYNRNVVSGKSQPATILKSDREIIAKVEQTPSSIGYLSHGAVVFKEFDKVRIINLSDEVLVNGY